MKRRTYLELIAASSLAAIPALARGEVKPIVLLVDLEVDPAKEQQMLHIFHTQFAPTAAKQPGFIDVQMLKLRKALQGPAPAGANYRFTLKMQSEEDRQKWIATPIHNKLWPTIEATLVSKNYTVLLYDVA